MRQNNIVGFVIIAVLSPTAHTNYLWSALAMAPLKNVYIPATGTVKVKVDVFHDMPREANYIV